jgi:hypothetical protein
MVFPNWWNGYRSITEGKTMDTKRNTAAIYVRRSAADRRDADESDNRSHARQGRDSPSLGRVLWGIELFPLPKFPGRVTVRVDIPLVGNSDAV